jgi:hypothetical protein
MPQVHSTTLITTDKRDIQPSLSTSLRSKRALYLFFVMFAAILAFPCVEANADDSLSTDHARGKIEVSEYTFDFGYMPQGVVVVHEFKVTNVGKGMLNIVKVDPTCGCTTVPLKKTFLDPGDETGLRVEFKTGKYQGHVNKRIKVISTDPDNSLVELYIRGIVNEPPQNIEMIGPAVTFGTLDVLKREVTFKCTALQDVGLSVLSIPDDFLGASFSVESIKPQREAALTIELKKNPPLGDFSSSVTVECVGEKTERITIPVTGVGYAR